MDAPVTACCQVASFNISGVWDRSWPCGETPGIRGRVRRRSQRFSTRAREDEGRRRGQGRQAHGVVHVELRRPIALRNFASIHIACRRPEEPIVYVFGVLPDRYRPSRRGATSGVLMRRG